MRNRTRIGIVVIALMALGTPACVGYGSREVEKIPRKDRKLKATVAPSIDVVFKASLISDEESKISTPKVRDKLRKRFGRLQSQFKFLENAKEGNADPDYTLELHVRRVEKNWGSDELCGISLGLIPYSMGDRSEFRATLIDRRGREIYEHFGRTKKRLVGQMHLLWLAPLNLFTLPGHVNSEKKVVRSLLALIERDIAKNPDSLVGSVESSPNSISDRVAFLTATNAGPDLRLNPAN
jgi:hypothetical protein